MPKNTVERRIDGRPAVAGVVVSGSSGGGGGGVTDHGALTGLGDDDHPQYLTSARGDALFLTPAEGDALFLTPTEGDARYVPLARTVTAGAGLLNGGALTGDITLNVGAGNGIDVAADSVAVKLHATTPGLFVDANGLRVSLKASNPGLIVDVNGLYMGAPGDLAWNTTGGLTATGHVHTVVTSSAPGAAASILQTDTSGYLTLVRGIYTDRVRTPLIDTASGDLTLSPVGNVKLTSGTRIAADNYASQVTGWGITYAGEGDFRYIYTDELHAKSFIADLEQALAGGQIISKSVAVLHQAFTLPAAGGTAYFVMRDLPSAPGMQVFPNGDLIRFRKFTRVGGSLTIADAWGTVTLNTGYGASGFDAATRTQGYRFDRSAGALAGTGGGDMATDAIVLDYGVSENGYYEVNAIDGAYALNSPYAQVVTWKGHPRSALAGEGLSVRSRLGNLRGIFGMANEYGLYAGAGVTIADAYLRLSNLGAELRNVPLSMYNSGALTGLWQANGSLILSATDVNTSALRDFVFDAAAGTVRIGRTGVGVPNLLWNGSALHLRQNATPVITLDSDGNSNFSGIMTIGASGEIRQGTVASGNVWDSWASIGSGFTGLRVWRDGNIGRIAGYNGGTLQWGATTTGKLTVGGGTVVMGADGVRMTEQDRAGSMPVWNASALTFVDTNDIVRAIVAAYKRTTGGDHGVVFGTTNPSIGQVFQYGMEVENNGSINLYGNTTANGTLTIANTLSVTGLATLTAGAMLGAPINTSAGVALELKQAGTSILRSQKTGDDAYLELGSGRTADGAAYIDLVGDTTYTDYGARLARYTGANGTTVFSHRGTGVLRFAANEAAAFQIFTNGANRFESPATGGVIVYTPSSGTALTVNGKAGEDAAYITGPIKAGDSEGMKLKPAFTRTVAASGASPILISSTGFVAFLIVVNNTTGRVGLFVLSNAVTVQIGVTAGMSAAKATASSINVYAESGNYYINNMYGTAQTIAVFYFLGT